MAEVEIPLVGRRPGLFIKDYLEKKTASIAELHRAYCQLIKAENKFRDKRKMRRLKKPVYSSFYKYFKNFVALGLVEMVGEEISDKQDLLDNLAFVQKVEGRLEVVDGVMRRLWGLTPDGRLEEKAWEDPLTARGYYPRVKKR